MNLARKSSIRILLLGGIFLGLLFSIIFFVSYSVDKKIIREYTALESEVTYDRTGEVVRIALNPDEQVCMFATTYPKQLSSLVLRKEDDWFYYHPGVHVFRLMSVAIDYLNSSPHGGASTITQQLGKTLLHATSERTFTNKLYELGVAFVLELYHSKDDILVMYLNTVPLGGNIQGFPAAARAYFGKQVAELNENEVLQLMSALSNPNSARPLTDANFTEALALAQSLGTVMPLQTESITKDSGTWLELTDLLEGCVSCTATIDIDLTERIRNILANHIERGEQYGSTHGAVAVVDVRTGEILALVGSPSPDTEAEGMRINMALETRPIGSTIKPFLYLLGFTKGLRPYTLVEDREYKYEIETGFPLYPKNYDGKYRGTVTLEESLANSLNVPTVEVQRFITLPETYAYLERVLGFSPRQSWDSYAYGIALGGLELDLVTLTHSFTALANRGTLHRLVSAHTKDGTPHYFTPPHSVLHEDTVIANPDEVALVNSILTDRTAGVEQFGISGSLQLSRGGYGVKTGTSRDYHDSWTVGYTGDFAVGVWLGNVKNTPMNMVSGSTGAGMVWHDVMELMFTTPYDHHTSIDLSSLVTIPNERGHSWGLASDNVEVARTLLESNALILFPHDLDTFLFSDGMRVPLTARVDAVWSIEGNELTEDAWYPSQVGTYTITAHTGTQEEQITVRIVSEPTRVPQ
ncbi:TPA: hypothetical protein DEP58_00310 [Patescibacteria group bacterium]|nr:MAG: hypothetical protein UU98_C0023G0011 [Parcubacteria group bacterium GW2011_GWD2_42_14]HCC04730.1 hypothetical protein [Patescibacteria group bacterium]